MRQQPDPGSKVVSQALFGELIEVEEQEGGWCKIATSDRYTGWALAGAWAERSTPYLASLHTTRLAAHLYKTPDIEYGPVMTLPYGSGLHLLATIDSRWHQVALPDGAEAFIQQGDTYEPSLDLASFVQQFLGIPYTWGGRSSFGYDCSGFVQMIYKHLKVCLPRDARQQISCSRKTAELACGDLIFWGRSETDIRHVGIFLGSDQFIHASSRENKPYVRVSSLSDQEWSAAADCFYPFRVYTHIEHRAFHIREPAFSN